MSWYVLVCPGMSWLHILTSGPILPAAQRGQIPLPEIMSMHDAGRNDMFELCRFFKNKIEHEHRVSLDLARMHRTTMLDAAAASSASGLLSGLAGPSGASSGAGVAPGKGMGSGAVDPKLSDALDKLRTYTQQRAKDHEQVTHSFTHSLSRLIHSPHSHAHTLSLSSTLIHSLTMTVALAI